MTIRQAFPTNGFWQRVCIKVSVSAPPVTRREAPDKEKEKQQERERRPFMNFNNFTIKSQEAVQEAVNLVQNRGQQAIEPEHLMAGLLKVGENVTNFIFQKLGINGQQIETVLDRQIASLPKVSGGEPYLSRDANEVLQKAVEVSKELGDEYVSLEAILLALLNVKSTVSTMLKDAGLTDKELRAAIQELRQGQNVTSQSSEDTYQSLNKYAINLIEAARSGKLDPVIETPSRRRLRSHLMRML